MANLIFIPFGILNSSSPKSRIKQEAVSYDLEDFEKREIIFSKNYCFLENYELQKGAK